ncbi:DUF982 domain-containing protein [Rhizobium sp. S152]|uniref:DUF982 domain-containing protein n=1 Tax=Rhizobium sp. S152 TaxID=3055038 RepID=UPI0025AA1B3B|nr:DUF982 domain-containing protein [Rhizobium sp. S152]MDM9626279.1 DUF982 domain-containing protein [Rhizobium sp. S152]
MQEDLIDVRIPPIGIAIDDPGRYRVVDTITGLTAALIDEKWSAPRGDMWRAAVAACIRSLDVQADGEAAREVFILAAREAHMPLKTAVETLIFPERLAKVKRKPKPKPTWPPRAH